jgi:hypothetical protein
MESAPGPPWSGWDRADDRLWGGLAGGNEVGVRRSEERNATGPRRDRALRPGLDFHRLDRTSFAWRTHSITSSARSRNHSEIVSPSDFAVLRLTTSSNLSACSTGRSAGLVPCKILCT